MSMAQLMDTPALKPPPGYTTDFADPGKDGSNASQTIVTISVLLGITVTVLMLRLYTRFVVLKSPGWDDYCAAAATVGAAVYSALIIYVFRNGFGVHQWNVRVSTLLELTDYLNAILYIYKPFMLAAKLSLCFFFLRMFRQKKGLRWSIYFAIAYNVVLQITAFFLAIFLCLPGRPSFWGCSHTISKLNVATAGCNIFADVYLLIIPLVGIRGLQMSSSRKLGISMVFMAGILTCVASILGLIYRIKQNDSPDTTWTFSPEIILVTFELEATIIVGCMLLMPALFRSTHPLSLGSMWSKRKQLFKYISGSRRSSASQQQGHGGATIVEVAEKGRRSARQSTAGVGDMHRGGFSGGWSDLERDVGDLDSV